MLGGQVSVVLLDMPVLGCEDDGDPRQLDAKALRLMHDRVLDSLLVVLAPVREQVVAKTKSS